MKRTTEPNKKFIQESLNEVSDVLQSAVMDKSERYVLTKIDQHGERKEIVNREQYLEFVIGSTLDRIVCIQEDIEELEKE